jgi:phosphoribosyl-AMP cyclohydrolase
MPVSDAPLYARLADKAEIEEGERLAPKFDANGLLTAVTVDADRGDVLMVAHMDAEALALTIETREAHYFSRSRGRLWKKGEESGHIQRVVELAIDCDQDAVVLRVRMEGPGAACHTGHRSCFFRSVPLGVRPSPEMRLGVNDGGKVCDPKAVYAKPGDKPRF